MLRDVFHSIRARRFKTSALVGIKSSIVLISSGACHSHHHTRAARQALQAKCRRLR